MNILITAGNTQTPIDRVRCITNIFTGRTGTSIALYACERGHRVKLLTSHPEILADMRRGHFLPSEQWQTCSYRTFEELAELMEKEVGKADAIIHSAAVSDYRLAGVYAPAPGTGFDEAGKQWHGPASAPPTLEDRAADKVKSDAKELWLRLIRAPKLIDRIRGDWHFQGILVKFKLEAGVSDEKLLEVAEQSRLQSNADFMVANTLEEAASWAYLGPLQGRYERLERSALPRRLLEAIEGAGK